MGLKTGARPDRQIIAHALDELGVGHLSEHMCARLSAGQKMRVFLAMLKFAQRKIWLLDEAGATLDSAGRKILNDMISRHIQKQEGCVILASHDPGNFTDALKVEME